MPALKNFTSYGGLSPVTASIRNALAHQGQPAPHTGLAPSEALLFGITGGAAFGYFVFRYQGYLPQINLLTRNTLNSYGWDAIVAGLGIAQDVIHSSTEDKAEAKLVDALEEGSVPIVWADVFTLGYEYSDFGEGMWAMCPLIVYEYDLAKGYALVADRSAVPHKVSIDLLRRARAKVKKDKFRMVILENPDYSRLGDAVRAGLNGCVALFREAPPVGAAHNFGFAAYQKIRDDLRDKRGKSSWAAQMPGGAEAVAGLITAFRSSQLFWKDDSRSADRLLFAAFLDEAQTILKLPTLADAATAFRQAAQEWKSLGDALLPDREPLLKRAKELAIRRHALCLAEGSSAISQLKELDRELDNLMTQAKDAHTAPGEVSLTDIRESAALAFERIETAERQGIAAIGSALN